MAFNNLQWMICHKTKPDQIKNKIFPWTTTHGYTNVVWDRKDLYASALSEYWRQSRGPAKSDG